MLHKEADRGLASCYFARYLARFFARYLARRNQAVPITRLSRAAPTT